MSFHATAVTPSADRKRCYRPDATVNRHLRWTISDIKQPGWETEERACFLNHRGSEASQEERRGGGAEGRQAEPERWNK